MVDSSGEVSIRKKYTRGVWNIGSDRICYCVVPAEMVTIMYRMLGLKHLELSPKILVDARCVSIPDAKDIITNSDLGLQSVHDYPFMFARNLYEKFEYQQGLRYWIDELINHYDPSEIRKVIRQTYSKNGKKKPLIASVKMGKFRRSEIALDAFERPFRHDMDDYESVEKESLQCLLIVGANFSSKNKRDHYCVVKGCYGEEWGKEGFSKIALEMVQRLSEPVLLKKNTAYVGWKEKRTWAEGKITVVSKSKNKKRRVSQDRHVRAN